jgi:hypothetical protein
VVWRWNAERRPEAFCATREVGAELAKIHDEAAGIAGPIEADRDQSTIGPRGGCFGAARTSANPCGARRLGLDHQPMAVLDQDMTHAARSGLLAAAFGQR